MASGQIAILALVALANGVFLLGLSLGLQKIFGIHTPGGVKNESYECGMKPMMDSNVQFDIKYYLFAILFIVFDVEFVFLMPWANLFNNLQQGTRSFIIFEAFVFVLILFVALIYAWRKGALDWEQEPA